MRINGAQKILAFTTNGISDPGVDLAGSSHMDYSPTVKVITLPCSSGIDPRWIVHALESGFDGVFIAADGTDCAYLHDCTDRTGRVVQRAQDLLRDTGQDPRRLKMAAVCSVCAESLVAHVEAFDKSLRTL